MRASAAIPLVPLLCCPCPQIHTHSLVPLIFVTFALSFPFATALLCSTLEQQREGVSLTASPSRPLPASPALSPLRHLALSFLPVSGFSFSRSSVWRALKELRRYLLPSTLVCRLEVILVLRLAAPISRAVSALGIRLSSDTLHAIQQSISN